ncbi:MAG: cupin domain-containing protein [Pseudomonadota bacterium]
MHFEKDIVARAKRNSYFREVLSTHEHCQLVVMSVRPGEDIGEEVHELDQVLVFVSGKGKAIVGSEEFYVGPGSLVVVPSGAVHNFICKGTKPLKLYTLYAPAEHPPGTIHKTRREADDDEHHHDGLVRSFTAYCARWKRALLDN